MTTESAVQNRIEIEQRIADAVNEIPLKEILQESKDRLKIKLERFEKYKPKPYNSMKRRMKARNLRKTKNKWYKFILFCQKCIKIGVLIMFGVFAYRFIIHNVFN